MRDKQALLAAVLANPEDDLPRLAYADWLEEHGQSDHSRFIRAECELAQLKAHGALRLDDWDASRADALGATPFALWRDNINRWYPGLGPFAEFVGTNRGFPNQLSVSVRKFITHAAAVFRIAPTIRSVSLDQVWKNMPALAACPALAHVRELEFSDSPFSAREATEFAASPHLGNLRSFKIWATESEIGPRGAIALTKARSLTRLEELDIHNHAISDIGAVALLQAPWATGLRVVKFTNNGLTAKTASALSQSDHLTQLAELNLETNHLDEKAMSLLRQAPCARVLRQLDLSYNPLGSLGATNLATAPFAQQLESLGIHECEFSDEALAALLEKPFSRLRVLSAGGNRPHLAAVRALAGNRNLEQVYDFSLVDSGISADLAAYLADARTLPGLRDLSLSYNPLGDVGIHRLLDGPLLAPVRTLHLDHVGTGDDGAKALANAPMPRLQNLWLGCNRITDVGARWLAESRTLEGLRSLWLANNPISDVGKAALRARFGARVQF